MFCSEAERTDARLDDSFHTPATCGGRDECMGRMDGERREDDVKPTDCKSEVGTDRTGGRRARTERTVRKAMDVTARWERTGGGRRSNRCGWRMGIGNRRSAGPSGPFHWKPPGEGVWEQRVGWTSGNRQHGSKGNLTGMLADLTNEVLAELMAPWINTHTSAPEPHVVWHEDTCMQRHCPVYSDGLAR